MISCIYHAEKEMRVVEDDEYERLLATGEWFKHPNDVLKKEIKDERQKRDGVKTKDAPK